MLLRKALKEKKSPVMTTMKMMTKMLRIMDKTQMTTTIVQKIRIHSITYKFEI